MVNSEETGANVIRLNVPDSIFEWDVLGNKIYLSKGARSQLALGDKQCLSMDEFSSHTPRDERLALTTSLTSFLHGAGGTTFSFSHSFDEMLVTARMTVVDRRPDGMVTRVIGAIHVEMVGAMQLVSDETAVSHGESETENESLDNAIAATEDGLWVWDVQDDLFRCSPRYLSMLGYSREEFPSRFDKVRELTHPDDLHKYNSMLQRLVHSPNFGKSFQFACCLRRADGVYAWMFVRGYITHRDYDGRALKVIGLTTDISGIQDGRARAEAQFRNDDLTDLRSRAFLNMECERIEKSNVRPVSVIALDLDGLKLVNDYLGHHAGDCLLKELALRMRRVLRATDCVARMGGDEFTVLLPSCTGKNARLLALRLGKELEMRNAESDNPPLLVSIGVGSAETVESTLCQALADADSEMLRIKHRRRPETHRILKEYIQNSQNVVVREDKSRHL